MSLKHVTDLKGEQAGVFIPIVEWNALKLKHIDLEELEKKTDVTTVKLPELVKTLVEADDFTETMPDYIRDSITEWECKTR